MHKKIKYVNLLITESRSAILNNLFNFYSGVSPNDTRCEISLTTGFPKRENIDKGGNRLSGKGKRILFFGVFAIAVFLFSSAWNANTLLQAASVGQTCTVTVSDFRYNTAEMPVGYFELSNGKMAFCACHEAKPPAKGTTLKVTNIYTAENKENELLRKVYYYGFKGPGDVGASYGETSLAGSVANGHMDVDDTGESDVGYGKSFIRRISNLSAAPKGFDVYKISTGNNTYQDLTFWEYHPEGKLTLTKISADTEISEAGSGYSLEGAVYGVYTDPSCTKKEGELKTDIKGKSNTLTLQEGTYYVKEIKASSGYGLDDRVYKIQVKSQSNEFLQVEEQPQYQNMEILTVKYDREMGDENGGAQGAASLEGAEFTCSFYRGFYDSLQELQKEKPLKTWVFRSGKDGKVYFREEALISGDSFWKDQNGNPILPLGTVTIEETKAPEGYNRNEEIFVRKITSSGNGPKVETYENPVVPEDIIRGDLEIIKVYQPENEKEDTLKGIEGVVFSITSKTTGKEVMRIQTDEKGRADTKREGDSRGGLVYDTYIVEEIKTPKGYNAINPFEVTIQQENTVVGGIYKQDTLISSAIQVQKTDRGTGKVIPRAGAKFQLLDENKQIIVMKTYYPSVREYDIFTTDENGRFTFPSKLGYGTYYLREVEAPEGYLLNRKDIKFIVTEDLDWEKPLIISCADENAMGRISLRKYEKDTEKYLEGAVYEIRAAEDISTPDGTVRFRKGELADTITTSKNGPVLSKNLWLGNYILKEIQQPAGYVLDSKQYEVSLKYKNQETAVVTEEQTVYDMPTKLIIEKYKKGEEDIRLPEVRYEIWPENDPQAKKVYTTDSDGRIIIQYLLPDTVYCIRETEALPGYLIDETIYKVKIDKKGQIEGDHIYTLRTDNDCTKYKISKQDITTEKEIKGAEMILYLLEEDGSRTEVETWISKEQPHYVEELIIGKTYILLEKTAPKGYLQAEEITFTVPESGKIQTITMKDKNAMGQISISKMESGEEEVFLEDTVFEIRAAEDIVTPDGSIRMKEGELADTIVTGGGPSLSQPLFLGKYVIKEVKQPAGYVLDSKEYEVELTYKDQHEACVTEKIKIFNEPTKLHISKKDKGSKKMLEGARLRLEQIKEDGTRYIIARWTSGRVPQEFERLVPGRYSLIEEEAPKGYETADEILFVLEETGEIQTVDMLDEKKEEAVQTGDHSLIVSRALLLALAALLAGVALWIRNRDEERRD